MNFDPGAFFTLHDYDSTGAWTPEDVRRTYGLNDENMKDKVSAEKKEEVTREVFRLFDGDRNGIIEREEWMKGCAAGARLPDFGVSWEAMGLLSRLGEWRARSYEREYE